MVAQWRRRQLAFGRARVGQAIASDLIFTQTIKVMDVKILVALPFGVPQDRYLQALQFLRGNPANPPLSGQRLARVVKAILAAQRQVQRWLAFGTEPGG